MKLGQQVDDHLAVALRVAGQEISILAMLKRELRRLTCVLLTGSGRCKARG
jgi:hypothetical protein